MPAESRWEEIGALFDAALERPAAERRDWLANICAGDAALRREVEQMLTAHERGGGILEQPIPTPPSRPDWTRQPEELPAVLRETVEERWVGALPARG